MPAPEPLRITRVPGRLNCGLVRKKEGRYYCARCLEKLSRMSMCHGCHLTMHPDCADQAELRWACGNCAEEEYGGP